MAELASGLSDGTLGDGSNGTGSGQAGAAGSPSGFPGLLDALQSFHRSWRR